MRILKKRKPEKRWRIPQSKNEDRKKQSNKKNEKKI